MGESVSDGARSGGIFRGACRRAGRQGVDWSGEWAVMCGISFCLSFVDSWEVGA